MTSSSSVGVGHEFRDLLVSTQNGAVADLERLLPELRSITRHNCKKFGVAADEMDDVLQEVMARLLDRRYRSFDPLAQQNGPLEPAVAYVVGHVLNAIGFATRRRRRQFEDELAEQPCHHEDPYALVDARLTIARLLETTDDVTRAALVSVYAEERTEREAAQLLNTSAPTLCRILRRFRDRAAAVVGF